jgi:hypothetical protein
MYLVALLCLAVSPAWGQTAQDEVVPILPTIDLSTPSVTLTWSNPTASNIQLIRREKGDPTWYILLQEAATTMTSFTDPFIAIGQTYEYRVQRVVNGLTAYGFVSVPVEAPVVDNRGTVSIFVEAALQTPLSSELEQLGDDLIGEGWEVHWNTVPTNATVATVKTQIINDYNNYGTSNILLFGAIPVPYSGNFAWDGHPEHRGAWPADIYYGDAQNTGWTDVSVNTATNPTPPGRPETANVPGDGKFDQFLTPSTTEMVVGRVDFSNMNEADFGPRIELYRRYLKKNHDWRTGQYTVDTKALVDDNFGYFNGEAFASDGYRNGNPLVGPANVMAGDFFNDTDDQSFLFAYGCGAGNYNGANGVGSSSQFASDTVNVVFSMLFGSYFGDWDYNNNPFMMSALASKGGILTCNWAGRPHWVTHHLGAGETIGYSTLLTQNSCEDIGYFQVDTLFSYCGTHVSLLGDPTVRAQIVSPVGSVTASQFCNQVNLDWSASAQSDVIGYHVYRSSNAAGPFVRLSGDPITSTDYLDDLPQNGENHYMVKAVVREETPSGIFFNTSTGVRTQLNFIPAMPPDINVPATVTLTCANPTFDLDPCGPGVSCIIKGPGFMDLPPVTISQPGTYLVHVTSLSNGCSATETMNVQLNTIPPAGPTVSLGNVNCAAQTVQLLGMSNPTGVAYAWSGPNGFTSAQQNPTASVEGGYTLTVTQNSNGCTSSASVTVPSLALPLATATGGALTCGNPSVQLTGSSNAQNVSFEWTGPNGYTSTVQSPTVSIFGDYLLVVTNGLGCTGTAVATVTQAGNIPTAAPVPQGVLTCIATSVTIMANPGQSGLGFSWTGPNGFTSTVQNPIVTVAGIYSLQVTDPGTGCSGIYSTTVLEDTALPNFSVPDFEINCTTTTTIVDLSPICGLPGIACTLNGQIVTGPVTLEQPGPYELVVTSTATGCSASDVFNLNENIAIPDVSINFNGDPVLECSDDEITLTATSSTPGVSFFWIGLNGNPSQTVPSGTYTVVVTDPSNGCTASESITIGGPAPLEINNVIFTINCDGSIEEPSVSVTGGTPPYSFTFTPSPPFPPGSTYIVVVTDDNGCTTSQSGFVISNPILLTASATSTNETVLGANDGTATASATGGLAPYFYLWNNGATTAFIDNLAPGTYTCVVTDGVGCTSEITVTIAPGTSSTYDLPGLRNLLLAPNPTSGLFIVTVELENPLPLQVELVDVTGRILLQKQVAAATENRLPLDLSNHVAGIYYCKITAGGQVAVRKVVKMGQ